MLKALFRVRLAALGATFTGASRSKTAQSKPKLIGFALLMLFCLACFLFLFWQMFVNIAGPFRQMGLGWLYFSMAALMGFALMFIGSVFTAKAQLYEAKDNDLLLSLPIKPAYVLLSRMFMLWVLSLVMELLVAIPALVAWQGSGGFGGAELAWFIVIFILLLPFLALAVSALFGWILSLVSTRIGGNKSLITVALSLIFLVAYMYFAANMETLLSELAMNPGGAARAPGAVAVLKWIGDACAAGSLAAGLKVAAVIIVCFGAVYFVLAKSFVRTATDRRGGGKRKAAVLNAKARSTDSALFSRELSRLLSSPGYLLNCGLGAFLAPIGAVVLLIKGGELLAMPGFEGYPDLFALLFLAALCMMSSMCIVSAPSVSLEGKSLWVARSLPVSTRAVLSAKLRLHYVVSLPSILIAAVLICVLIKPRGLMLLYYFALPGLTSVFLGLLGLTANLRHPKLDYVNETQAVKSSVAVMITMFTGMGLVTVLSVGYLFLAESLSFELYGGLILLLLAAGCLLLRRYIMTKGVKLFEQLQA